MSELEQLLKGSLVIERLKKELDVVNRALIASLKENELLNARIRLMALHQTKRNRMEQRRSSYE